MLPWFRIQIFRAILAVGLAVLCSQHVYAQSASRLTDDELVQNVQRATFEYFWEGAEPNSGWARERIHLDEPDKDKFLITSGGTGFGLMAILVGIERGFVPRNEAVARINRILEFAKTADRFHGVWPHWLDGTTGRVVPFSPDDDGGDLVETSFFAVGLICVDEYFRNGTEQERAVATKARQLRHEIEWDWYRGPNKENVLYWHWSPRVGWKMNFSIRGYNECLITYVLAASSPTFPVSADVYHQGWAKSGAIVKPHEYLGVKLQLDHQGVKQACGPLYWAHYSFLGLDPYGLKDRYCDYETENKSHVEMVWQHCVKNPGNFDEYGEDLWGLTSSYSLNFYNGHSPENDNGTISPTAALASFPYSPAKSLRVMRYLYEKDRGELFGKFGFYDAYNPSQNFKPPRYLAIDQGPIVIMLENHRSQLLWRLFMGSDEIKNGLKKLDFSFPESPRR